MIEEHLKSLGVDPQTPQVYVIERGDMTDEDIEKFTRQWKALTESAHLHPQSVVILTDAESMQARKELTYDLAHHLLMKGLQITRKAWLNKYRPYLPFVAYEHGTIWHNRGYVDIPEAWVPTQADLTATDWVLVIHLNTKGGEEHEERD